MSISETNPMLTLILTLAVPGFLILLFLAVAFDLRARWRGLFARIEIRAEANHKRLWVNGVEARVRYSTIKATDLAVMYGACIEHLVAEGLVSQLREHHGIRITMRRALALVAQGTTDRTAVPA